MAKNLVIVESPAKAKTINKYLGKDYLVKASIGHIKDLPSKGLGVDIDDDFKPTYEVIPDSKKRNNKKIVSELKAAAKAADNGAVPVESLGMQFFNWILGCVLIYSTLFGIGKLIFKEWLTGTVLLAVALVVAVLISRNLSRADWSDTSEPG